MPPISFSLTETYLIDPILTMRAPLPPSGQGRVASWREIGWQGFQSEVAARVMAVSISFFAAVDMLIHLRATIQKSDDRPVAVCHFRQVTRFGALMVAGSIAGVIWPSVLENYRYSPLLDRCFAPRAIEELMRQAADADQQPFVERQAYWERVKQFWAQSSLEEKHWFVSVFSQYSWGLKEVREAVVDSVYQSLDPSRKLEWVADYTVTMRPGKAPYSQVCNSGFFYHPTTEQGLEEILRSKRIRVCWEKAFHGAFVSTTPETDLGRCLVVLRKGIERVSPLSYGFKADDGSYWAGFSRDIPVTNSLAYILLREGTAEQCETMQKLCQQWRGGWTLVLPTSCIDSILPSKEEADRGIPIEWPLTDPRKRQIMMTIRHRAATAESTDDKSA